MGQQTCSQASPEPQLSLRRAVSISAFVTPVDRWWHPVSAHESEGRFPARLDILCVGIPYHLVTIGIPRWTGTDRLNRTPENMPLRPGFSSVGSGADLPRIIP
jgi:hypothetical protein